MLISVLTMYVKFVRGDRRKQETRAKQKIMKALQFKDAAGCLNMTIQAMRLDSPEDREFLEKAMKNYAAMVIAEWLEGEKANGFEMKKVA